MLADSPTAFLRITFTFNCLQLPELDLALSKIPTNFPFMKGYSDIPRSVDSSRKLSARKRKMKSCGLRVPPKVEHGFGAEIGDWVVWVARMTRRLSG